MSVVLMKLPESTVCLFKALSPNVSTPSELKEPELVHSMNIVVQWSYSPGGPCGPKSTIGHLQEVLHVLRTPQGFYRRYMWSEEHHRTSPGGP